MENVLLANIAWNTKGWAEVQPNPKFNDFGYPPHESLNFNFDKKINDKKYGDEKYVHGNVAFVDRIKPKYFEDDGLILFCSTMVDEMGDSEVGDTSSVRSNKCIVGLYGKSKMVKWTTYDWKGLRKDKGAFNIVAEKDFSIHFPVYLDYDKYMKGKTTWFVKRFTYQLHFELAKQIILDEIVELKKRKGYKNDIARLKNIFEYYFGRFDKRYSAIFSPKPRN